MAKNQKKTGELTPTPSPYAATALDFDALLVVLVQTNEHISAQTTKAVNIGLTLRNWLFGCYIHTYEQNGADRAAYGEKLLKCLAERLQARNISRTDERELRRYRQFYMFYPQIRDSASPECTPHALSPSAVKLFALKDARNAF